MDDYTLGEVYPELFEPASELDRWYIQSDFDFNVEVALLFSLENMVL